MKRGYYKEFTATFKHVCQIILIAVFYLFATQTGEGYSRITLVLTGIIYAVISYIARILWKKYLKTKGVLGKGNRSLLIITSEEMMDTVIDTIRNNNYEGFQIKGISLLDADRVGERINDVPVVATLENVEEYVCREWVDEVFLDLPKEVPLPRDLINDFIEMGITIHLKLIEMAKLEGEVQRVERLGSYTVLTSSINMASWKQALYKRAMDIAGGLIGCIITGILYLIVAPCIYIKSPGPVFFSQIRVGKNGKRFKLYKFRSMYMDAEERKKELMAQNEMNGLMFKMQDDPRITKVGKFIRKTSIDELPQFFDVLRGDMSLVGTRPPTLDEYKQYESHHKRRLSMKPGITGLWQVSGRSDIEDFEDVVKLDVQYIDNWSLWGDIKILFKTVWVVFAGRGAK